MTHVNHIICLHSAIFDVSLRLPTTFVVLLIVDTPHLSYLESIGNGLPTTIADGMHLVVDVTLDPY